MVAMFTHFLDANWYDDMSSTTAFLEECPGFALDLAAVLVINCRTQIKLFFSTQGFSLAKKSKYLPRDSSS